MKADSRAHGWLVVGYLALGSAVLGIVLGVIWRLVAPRPELVILSDGVGYASIANSGVGMDLSLGLLCAAGGVIVAIAALKFFKDLGVYALLGVAIGGVLGSIVAWRVGIALVAGPHEYGSELAQGRADGEHFDGPLAISAYGVLGMWTFFGCLALAIGFGLRARRFRRKVDAEYQAYQQQVAEATVAAPGGQSEHS